MHDDPVPTCVQVCIAVLYASIDVLLHLLCLQGDPVTALSQHLLQVHLGGGGGVAGKLVAGEEGLYPEGVALDQLAGCKESGNKWC